MSVEYNLIFRFPVWISTARISFQFQSNYCNIHKSTRHWDGAFPPCCHLLRDDSKLKCCGANKHTDIHKEAHTSTDNCAYTHKLSRPSGHTVWVKNREWEWASSCRSHGVGWALRRAARGWRRLRGWRRQRRAVGRPGARGRLFNWSSFTQQWSRRHLKGLPCLIS